MKYFILFISTLFLISCSTRKDKFLNRKFHALVTKYNVLYNGKNAFEKGLEKVESTYSDDFTNVLPIEPFSFYAEERVDDDVKPIGQSDFEEAEEKAVKSIQKHSMLIDGEEKNPQIDEAYLLLGKSRYYTKRFTPALESFEYIIKNYPSASLIYETVVWRAKSNIHSGNVNFGKKALLRLLTSSRLTNEVRQQAELGVVMAYEQTPDSIDQRIAHLEASLDAVDKGVMASRAAFVLGQLYRNKGDIESSDEAFEKVINTKNGLYKYKLQSKLEKINNHIEDYSTQEFLEEVDHLIFVRKNRPYVNKLLFQKGLIYEKADSIQLAKSYYVQSIQKSEQDIHQEMIAYEQLGDISYGEKNYKFAKSYYDSLIDVSKNEKSLRVIRIKRKSNSLEKIVTTIEAANKNDSLLKVASLSESELNTFFQAYIDGIKQAEKNQRIKELKALAAQNRATNKAGANSWYFYNSKLRTEGREEFQKIWKPSRKDGNWFASSLFTSIGSAKTEEKGKDSLQTNSTTKYDVTYYTSQINRDPKFLDSITKSRNLNYYELGNAYYNQLKEKDLAVEKLKQLIAFNSSDDLKMGAYYRLYKIYKETGEEQNSDYYKQKLQEEFPKSSFTKLANNVEELAVDEEENEYIKCYETIYELYLLNSFEAALEEVNLAKIKYADTDLAPKYALLHAYIVAKIEGKEAFKKLLEEIKLRYPNTDEAKKALEFLNNK
ncbi:tetratricopeptide repeat protein [Wenyingzhuangia sp. chi5]|uniref:Tetratricopeptide repeat protein n=1 Tax=Wenyingzhuangia gilva TaxID=3057677 RepID=A0ABT8VPJ6_9FLAO|nr:tetratricopeptide repeat protein [Wenyingzhuangia sp. chi5]MDO3693900.1 tetratricopeptide repeat protein [Wenyingzhuangia sp. chi5]